MHNNVVFIFRLFNTYTLWLEETRLDTLDAENLNLPPQYDSKRLQLIFQGKYSHWNEFIYLPAIRNAQKKNASEWLRKCSRLVSKIQLVSQTSVSKSEIMDPKARIYQRLKLYDKPIPPPPIEKSSPPLRTVHIYNPESIVSGIQQDFLILQNFTKLVVREMNDVVRLNKQYMDLIDQEYENVDHRAKIPKSCDSSNCSKQLYITIKVN